MCLDASFQQKEKWGGFAQVLSDRKKKRKVASSREAKSTSSPLTTPRGVLCIFFARSGQWTRSPTEAVDDVRARVKTGQRVLVPACKLGWLVGKVARAGQRSS